MVLQVTVDLVSDFQLLMLAELRAMGVEVPPTETTVDKVAQIFWNAQKRYIPVRPRRVHLASEFKMPGNKADADGVALLLGMFQEGVDLNPNRSRAARKPKPFPTKKQDPFHDGLLNEWSIHHFHVGDPLEADGHVNRTSLLVFAMLKPDDAYVIDALPHRSESAPSGNWSRQDLLDRVHSDWPFLLKEFREPREDGDVQRLTDEEIATIRKKGGNTTFTAKDGSVYYPPGGGQVSAGIGIHVMMRAMRSVGVVSAWNEWLKENADCIVDTIQRAGRPVPDAVKLSLMIDDKDDMYACESALRVNMRLGPLFPPPDGQPTCPDER